MIGFKKGHDFSLIIKLTVNRQIDGSGGSVLYQRKRSMSHAYANMKEVEYPT